MKINYTSDGGILNTIRKSRSEIAYQNYVKIYPEKHVILDEEFNFNELEKEPRVLDFYRFWS